MAKSMTKKRPDGDAGAEPSFEKGIARLEQIVELLDDGNLPLDESLALFKEGTRLAKACRTQLEAAEVEVKKALAEDEEDLEDEEVLEDNEEA